MKTIKPFGISLVLFLALAVVTLIATIAARKWPALIVTQNAQQKRVVDTLPPVISSIKGIEVISAFIDDKGLANITIFNKTGKPIVGLSLSAGNLTFSDDNGISQDNPKTLIAPNDSYTFQESVTNLKGHEAIRVSAVFYADTSEEGDVTVRKNVHEERERQRQKRMQAAKEKKSV